MSRCQFDQQPNGSLNSRISGHSRDLSPGPRPELGRWMAQASGLRRVRFGPRGPSREVHGRTPTAPKAPQKIPPAGASPRIVCSPPPAVLWAAVPLSSARPPEESIPPPAYGQGFGSVPLSDCPGFAAWLGRLPDRADRRLAFRGLGGAPSPAFDRPKSRWLLQARTVYSVKPHIVKWRHHAQTFRFNAALLPCSLCRRRHQPMCP